MQFEISSWKVITICFWTYSRSVQMQKLPYYAPLRDESPVWWLISIFDFSCLHIHAWSRSKGGLIAAASGAFTC